MTEVLALIGAGTVAAGIMQTLSRLEGHTGGTARRG